MRRRRRRDIVLGNIIKSANIIKSSEKLSENAEFFTL
jgi:hypothetical protein